MHQRHTITLESSSWMKRRGRSLGWPNRSTKGEYPSVGAYDYFLEKRWSYHRPILRSHRPTQRSNRRLFLRSYQPLQSSMTWMLAHQSCRFLQGSTSSLHCISRSGDLLPSLTTPPPLLSRVLLFFYWLWYGFLWFGFNGKNKKTRTRGYPISYKHCWAVEVIHLWPTRGGWRAERNW